MVKNLDVIQYSFSYIIIHGISTKALVQFPIKYSGYCYCRDERRNGSLVCFDYLASTSITILFHKIQVCLKSASFEKLIVSSFARDKF